MMWAKSNQGGIETCIKSALRKVHIRAKSNQGGIETSSRLPGTDLQLGQNRTKVGLKLWAIFSLRGILCAKSNQGGIETAGAWNFAQAALLAKSNQGGIETRELEHLANSCARAKSNQGGIETGQLYSVLRDFDVGQNRTKVGLKRPCSTSVLMYCFVGKIEPRWD